MLGFTIMCCLQDCSHGFGGGQVSNGDWQILQTINVHNIHSVIG